MQREVDAAAGTVDDDGDAGDEPTEVDADEPAGDSPPARRARVVAWAKNLPSRAWHAHPAAWLVFAGAVIFALVFGSLGVKRHNTFGTWSFDLGIYDQGFWLVSRGSQTFMTVRGLDFWGQHLNLIAYAFAPFYWLGAGPRFLFVAQAIVLGAGAIPTYLIAKDRFKTPWMGLVFGVVYLMYAPIQWISWANFHPEALVVTPFLFAWWFSMHRRWSAMFVALLVALSTREDTALAVIMMGLVLLVYVWKDGRRARKMAGLVSALGVGWYVFATKLFMPHFNGGVQPFYIEYFYGSYGKDMPEIAETIVKHPNRVVSDATKPDRIRFYRDLSLPLGGMVVLGVGGLLMAAPQMLASVIGSSPYARQIRYQYTSVMIAPLIIAAIEGTYLLWRFKVLRFVLPVWLLVSAYVTNVAWSPSPIGDYYAVWGQASARNDVSRSALALVPDDASVTATYQLLPHLAHREQIYDWPNPFVPAYWGNDDCYRLPSPTAIEYIVVDRNAVGAGQQQLFSDMIAPGGPFQVLFDRSDIVVAKRVGTSTAVDVTPQDAACAGKRR
ncbi:MAG: DUF2079 domain-containing protein [Ilumatobacteraceae bacterium]